MDYWQRGYNAVNASNVFSRGTSTDTDDAHDSVSRGATPPVQPEDHPSRHQYGNNAANFAPDANLLWTPVTSQAESKQHFLSQPTAEESGSQCSRLKHAPRHHMNITYPATTRPLPSSTPLVWDTAAQQDADLTLLMRSCSDVLMYPRNLVDDTSLQRADDYQEQVRAEQSRLFGDRPKVNVLDVVEEGSHETCQSLDSYTVTGTNISVLHLAFDRSVLTSLENLLRIVPLPPDDKTVVPKCRFV